MGTVLVLRVGKRRRNHRSHERGPHSNIRAHGARSDEGESGDAECKRDAALVEGESERGAGWRKKKE